MSIAPTLYKPGPKSIIATTSTSSVSPTIAALLARNTRQPSRQGEITSTASKVAMGAFMSFSARANAGRSTGS